MAEDGGRPGGDPVRVSRLEEGRIARISLDAGRGNVLSRDVIALLDGVFEDLARDTEVRAVVLTAEGKDFSWGASVPEHAPGEVEHMLPAFGRLFRAIARSGVPVCAAVRGRCFGGGLELALAAHRIVVAEDAKLGLPEVTLGVFPPMAAAVLPLRVSQPTVDRLVVTGEIVDGWTAAELGLADEAVPAGRVEEEAMRWASRYLGLSGIAVRFATRAARSTWDDALDDRLTRLERLYLDELMKTRDAREGIAAFMEKRKPTWVNQ